MPASNVMLLDGIPTEIGGIMDPMGNAFHTVLSTDVSGSIVLILGCGPIGCFAVGIAKAAGRGAVIAVDVNPKRLELARKMGATRVLNPKKDDVDAAVLELSKGDGADVVCEMSGAPSALHTGFKLVRLGGRVHLLGIPDGDGADRLRQRDHLQGHHHLRRDRPQDVRDLAPDAAVPALRASSTRGR